MTPVARRIEIEKRVHVGRLVQKRFGVGNERRLNRVVRGTGRLCIMRRRVLAVGSCLWAVTGASLAFASLTKVNGDARVLVALASVAFPLCALGAAVALRR